MTPAHRRLLADLIRGAAAAQIVSPSCQPLSAAGEPRITWRTRKRLSAKPISNPLAERI